MQKSLQFVPQFDRPVRVEDVCVAVVLVGSIDVGQREVSDELGIVGELFPLLLQVVLKNLLIDILNPSNIIQFAESPVFQVVRVQLVNIEVEVQVKIELPNRPRGLLHHLRRKLRPDLEKLPFVALVEKRNHLLYRFFVLVSRISGLRRIRDLGLERIQRIQIVFLQHELHNRCFEQLILVALAVFVLLRQRFWARFELRKRLIQGAFHVYFLHFLIILAKFYFCGKIFKLHLSGYNIFKI